MGDNHEISGMIGAAGRNNNVYDNNFTQHIYEAAAFTPSALHQLPPPPREFVGRGKEMTDLLQAVEESSVTIWGLQGLGGVGKTALALKLAERLEPEYPDAQFYLELEGTSKQPLPVGEAMAHVIRAYHPKAQLPEDERSLQTIYLSALKGKKALLLMDNAASREQILPLIPPPGCMLLVTSRNHFMLNGLVAKNLDTLEISDAKTLLLKIAPRIGNCAETIAELCGYLPLALELAASALHKFIMLTPEEYVERLSKAANKRLELIETSLSVSYDLLTEEMQKRWRVLSVFPNTFDTFAVAALWELPVEETQERLAELISSSLVEWNDTTRRYRLHDLLKLLAQARVNQEERYAGGKYHAIYYREVLARAGALYLEGGDKITKGVSLFDLERQNIDSGQDWASANADGEQAVTHLSMGYYYAAYDLLSLRLYPREVIRWLEISLKAAHKLGGNKAFQSYSIGNLGIAYKNSGDPHKAIELYQQQLVITREISDRKGEGTALGNLGLAYADLGKTRKAIELHEQALEIDREIGDRRGEGIALGNLGNAYADLGETRKAIEFHEKALHIDREIGDRRGESADLGNLGLAYAALGETRKAIELYQQQLVITREIGDRRGEGTALGNLGLAYAALGETHKAIELYQQCLKIAREIGDRRGEGIALGNLGNAYADLGETRKAIEFHEKALHIDREIGDRRGESADLGNIGIAYKNLGEPRKAIELYQQQLVITREIGDQRGEGVALWNSALAYDKLSDWVQAISLAERATEIFEQIEAPGVSEKRATLDRWKTKRADKFNLLTFLKGFFVSSNE
jgi:tetratricopeptide (TPR) repeat protein